MFKIKQLKTKLESKASALGTHTTPTSKTANEKNA
jgi:hypothetical protein